MKERIIEERMESKNDGRQKPANSQELKSHPALHVKGISVSDYRAKIFANTLTLKPETLVDSDIMPVKSSSSCTNILLLFLHL